MTNGSSSKLVQRLQNLKAGTFYFTLTQPFSNQAKGDKHHTESRHAFKPEGCSDRHGQMQSCMHSKTPQTRSLCPNVPLRTLRKSTMSPSIRSILASLRRNQWTKRSTFGTKWHTARRGWATCVIRTALVPIVIRGSLIGWNSTTKSNGL